MVNLGMEGVPWNDSMGYARPLVVVPFVASEVCVAVFVQEFQWKG